MGDGLAIFDASGYVTIRRKEDMPEAKKSQHHKKSRGATNRELIDELHRLHEMLENHISISTRFAIGIVNGVGSAIGATIVFGLLVLLFLWFVQGTPIETFIEDTGIQSPFIEHPRPTPNQQF